MNPAYVESLVVIGPGLTGWDETAAILRDPSAYVPQDVEDVAIAMTPNERRRTTPVIRLALRALGQLTECSSLDLSKAASIFATSWGDLQVIDSILTTLTVPGIPVSPVQFHNVVHNTPAGYWSIASRARGSSTSVTAGEATFAAGLTDAMAALTVGEATVLFVCYDHPGPAILDRYHPVCSPFITAMALTAQPTGRYCCALRAEVVERRRETEMASSALEALRVGNAAARILPVLQAIAGGEGGRVYVTNPGSSSLAIDVLPALQQKPALRVDADVEMAQGVA
jgi:hypothetical protein